ncbi:hypothetical protein [Silvanigrella aquatica]|nr:hypothetical protein [Silvanigrella aquatica]
MSFKNWILFIITMILNTELFADSIHDIKIYADETLSYVKVDDE